VKYVEARELRCLFGETTGAGLWGRMVCCSDNSANLSHHATPCRGDLNQASKVRKKILHYAHTLDRNVSHAAAQRPLQGSWFRVRWWPYRGQFG
jgi:hypothetical protein